jgi:proteasome accessory factor C
MEIEVSETSVRAFLPPEFARPRRLTPAEGFAVAASARLIMAVPGPDDGALRRALSKLDAALGSREAIGVDVDAPHSLAAVRQACEDGQAVEIDYHSASRDEATTRVVEPMQVITMDGHWYLDAFCHRAGDMRRFRVDRISAVRPHGEPVPATPRPLRAADDPFVPGPGAGEVQLHLGPVGARVGARARRGPCGGWGRDRCGPRCRRHGLVRTAAAPTRARGLCGAAAGVDRSGRPCRHQSAEGVSRSYRMI